MTWNEEDHPRDELGRFTTTGGSETEESEDKPREYRYNHLQDGAFKLYAEKVEAEPEKVLYKNERIKKVKKAEENIYRDKLLKILGSAASAADVLYAGIEKLEKKIKDKGLNDKLEKIKRKETGDFGFDKSPWNIKHYYRISEDYNKEVGDFLRKNTHNPEYYSNDLRHQYVSAIFARNLGEQATKIMGDLNEMRDLRSQPGDSEIDQINNEIGREYAKLYPNMPRQELLKIMPDEHSKNQEIRIQKMKEKNKRNLDDEYM